MFQSFRRLARTPGFALFASIPLALGIGLSTAVFAVANALLLRPLPVLEQDRLVRVAGVTRDGRMDNYPLRFGVDGWVPFRESVARHYWPGGLLVFRRGMTMAGAGVAFGLVLATGTNRLLSSLLFGISPTDAATLVSVALVLLIAAAIACSVPARLSTRVEPAVALRSE